MLVASEATKRDGYATAAPRRRMQIKLPCRKQHQKIEPSIACGLFPEMLSNATTTRSLANHEVSLPWQGKQRSTNTPWETGP